MKKYFFLLMFLSCFIESNTSAMNRTSAIVRSRGFLPPPTMTQETQEEDDSCTLKAAQMVEIGEVECHNCFDTVRDLSENITSEDIPYYGLLCNMMCSIGIISAATSQAFSSRNYDYHNE